MPWQPPLGGRVLMCQFWPQRRVDCAIPVLPRAAPAHLPVGKLTAPLAGQAAHLAVGWLLELCLADEWEANSSGWILTYLVLTRKLALNDRLPDR